MASRCGERNATQIEKFTTRTERPRTGSGITEILKQQSNCRHSKIIKPAKICRANKSKDKLSKFTFQPNKKFL